MLDQTTQYASGFDDDPGLVDDNPDLIINCGHCGHEHICDPDGDRISISNIRELLKGI